MYSLVLDLNIVSSLPERVLSIYKQWKEVQAAKSLLEIPFTTVFEYMVLFRHVCLACSCLGSQLMVYSAAAVSDFYVPLRDMNTHKIQSSDGKPYLALTNTPKMLYMVSNIWAPEAYLVSFKLETDTTILLDKATSAITRWGYQKTIMNRYNVDCVVANILMTRYNEVRLVFNGASYKNRHLSFDRSSPISVEVVIKNSEEPLEAIFVPRLVQAHLHCCVCSFKITDE